MIIAYGKYGNTVDLVEFEKQIREKTAREFLSWLQEEHHITLREWRTLDEWLDEWLAQP